MENHKHEPFLARTFAQTTHRRAMGAAHPRWSSCADASLQNAHLSQIVADLQISWPKSFGEQTNNEMRRMGNLGIFTDAETSMPHAPFWLFSHVEALPFCASRQRKIRPTPAAKSYGSTKQKLVFIAKIGPLNVDEGLRTRNERQTGKTIAARRTEESLRG